MVDTPGLTTKLEMTKRSDNNKRLTANPTGLPGVTPVFSHASTVGNMSWAVNERVLGSIQDGRWVETLKPKQFNTTGLTRFRRFVCASLGRGFSPITHRQYCDKYTGSKRVVYERASSSLLSKPVVRQDAHITGFLKGEKHTKLVAPRVISPRDPRYLLSVGVFIAPLEHKIYGAIRRAMGHKVVMKGLDQEERAAVAIKHWNSFKNPVAVGLDASKFDQHCSVDALKYEHKFYRYAYNDDAELIKLLSWQLENHVFANLDDGKCKWVQKGGRMSGDVNTALGNCIISSGLLYAYSWHCGIKIRAMVDGDDCVVFMDANDLSSFMNGLPDWYKDRGFRMKIEGPYTTLEQIEFCQSKLMLLDVPIFVRNPYKAVNQDHTWIATGGITHDDVLAATGLGGLSIYGHIPVLGAYYSMLARGRTLSHKVRARLDLRSSWLRWTKVEAGHSFAEPTEEARIAFYDTFGMHPSDQRLLEAFYHGSSVPTSKSVDPNQITSAEFVSIAYKQTVLN